MAFQFGLKKRKTKIEESKKEDDDFSLIPGNENKEDWMSKKWRPMMAIMYMVCCIADFTIFPILFTVVQFWETQAVNDAFRQWNPITLHGGGFFHIAMGAVLGVSAFGRTQEKIAASSNVSNSTSSPFYQISDNVRSTQFPTQTQQNQAFSRNYTSSSRYYDNSFDTMTSSSQSNYPNLTKMRQIDPNNVFERG